MSEQLEIRAAAITQTCDDGMTLEGLLVPWETPTELFPGVYEQFARGSVTIRTAALKDEHRETIGAITQTRDEPDGLHITARISDTTRGRDVATLIRDGAVGGLSIGFRYLTKPEETELDGGGVLYTVRSAEMHEGSVVATPAYQSATITQLRSREDATMTVTTPEPTDVIDTQAREELAEIRRLVTTFSEAPEPTAAPTDTRTIGQVVKAIVGGDKASAEALDTTLAQARAVAAEAHEARAYTGSTTASTPAPPAYIGDLTRLVDQANPIAALFNTSPLPAEGTKIEFTRLKSNTIQVAKQAAEGDTLAFGKIETEQAFADLITAGGYTELSVQQIERSRVNALNLAFRAMAMAAGAYAASEVVAKITSLITANAANKITIANKTSWKNWNSGIIAAVQKFRTIGVGLDFILMDPVTFEAVANMDDSTGRPINVHNGDGQNTVGELSVRTLSGKLLTVPFYMFLGAPANTIAACSKDAINYMKSPLAQLQDTNVTNLTRQFSVYRYSAICDEIPAAIVPITATA